ncbi:hypothetical protein D3C84_850950 [compost metagenome]
MHRFKTHAAVLEFRLFRQGIERRLGQRIHATLEETVAPMHRQKRLARPHAVIAVDGHDHRAPATFQADQVSRLQAMAAQFVRVQAQHGFADVPEQLSGGPGAAHAVPLVAETASDQGQGETRIPLFLGGAIGVGDKLRTSAGSRENAVQVQPCRAFTGPLGEGPLLWAETVDQRMADAGQVQVPAASQLLVLIENL